MLVTGHTFGEVLQKLIHCPELAIDTETTGLRPFGKDRLFSIIVSTGEEEFYFNFHPYGPHLIDSQAVLSRALIPQFLKIFMQPGVIYGHNLIFDLQFLAKDGAFHALSNRRDLWCTEVAARIEFNDHLQYGLDACAKRIGLAKDDKVKEYLDKNKLYEWETDQGKKSRRKLYFFDQVPPDVILPYGERDARVCYELAKSQRQRFFSIDATSIGAPAITNVAENERKLTGVLFTMQRNGIRIDTGYCKQALEYERSRAADAKKQFVDLTGEDFIDSAKTLAPILHRFGIDAGITEKGNLSVADDVLAPHAEVPIVKSILEHRDAQKRANTYWSNYLSLVSPESRIHAWLRQAGTATGRFGCREPNLQNLTKKDDSQYPIRRAFIPDDKGVFVSIDYEQMEYRLMLDYAQELGVIDEVLGGLDVHQATANAMGTERQAAKTINFLLLYGGGTVKLCIALFHPTINETALWAVYKRWKGFKADKWTPEELEAEKHITPEQRQENLALIMKAEGLRSLYFEKLPKVKEFVSNVQDTAKRRGYIFNWLGRRCFFPRPEFAYKAPNYLIQGGCADIVKVGMVRLGDFVDRRSYAKMLINIHDEILFWVPNKSLQDVERLAQIMAGSYQPRKLPMACSVSWSDKSWGDLIEGSPA